MDISDEKVNGEHYHVDSVCIDGKSRWRYLPRIMARLVHAHSRNWLSRSDANMHAHALDNCHSPVQSIYESASRIIVITTSLMLSIADKK